jgi:O-antigen/teichoic acid export membrane protein
VWFTGLLGALITLTLSPWLSKLTFGNKDYTIAFVWLSVTLLFQQLSNGQFVVLQGLRKIQHLAKANMIGSLVGLVIAIPIYYFLHLEGIVPVIIIGSLITLILSWTYSRKVHIESVQLDRSEAFKEGKDMLTMGFLLSLSGIITLGTTYIIKIYITKTGGIEQVGLYNAGFIIINTYVGMIFTAMATDYYPRLSAVANNTVQTNMLINQQGEIAILIISPILAMFLIYANWILILFLSNRFLGVNEMIHWAALAMFFKAVTWSVGFILLAKGSSRLFFWNELSYSIYSLGLNIYGYKVAGLEGIGIALLMSIFIYCIQIIIVAKIKFSFMFRTTFYRICSLQLIICLACFGVVRFINSPLKFVIGTLIILVSISLSVFELDKRIGLKGVLGSIKEKFVKK